MSKELVLKILRSHKAELQDLGIESLFLFGSVARGEETSNSDIDIAANFHPEMKLDLLKMVSIKRKIEDLVGRPIDIVRLPAKKPDLQKEIERDQIHIF